MSWGTFFHYFPAKEDVLLDAAAEISRSYSTAIQAGLEEGRATEQLLADAFAEMFRTAVEAAPSSALRGKVLQYVISHPGRLSEYLGEEIAPPVPATTAVLAEGQLRGEIRSDEPAESLAVILLYAVLFSARRGASIGRPPASTPLGRLALAVVLRGMRPTQHPDRPASNGRPGTLPGAGWRAVAAEDFGAVGAAGGGGAVGVHRDGPAQLVDHDLVVERAVRPAVPDAGLAAAELAAAQERR
ncbi:MAG: TetR/AcrR family transcriptional regulator [Streptosporangiaceae bacterium]